MKTDSQEFKDLMKKWSDESWAEENQSAADEYACHEDMMGRLNPKKNRDMTV